MTIPSIQFRIIGAAKNDSSKDEIITIDKTSHGDFRVQYRSYFSQTSTVTYMRDGAAVTNYVQSLFELLRVDAEHCDSVQVDIAGFPVAIIRRDMLFSDPATISNVLRVVSLVTYNWPASSHSLST